MVNIIFLYYSLNYSSLNLLIFLLLISSCLWHSCYFWRKGKKETQHFPAFHDCTELLYYLTCSISLVENQVLLSELRMCWRRYLRLSGKPSQNLPASCAYTHNLSSKLWIRVYSLLTSPQLLPCCEHKPFWQEERHIWMHKWLCTLQTT